MKLVTINGKDYIPVSASKLVERYAKPAKPQQSDSYNMELPHQCMFCDVINKKNMVYYSCVCGTAVGTANRGIITTHANFCPNCGRRIDWSDIIPEDEI